VVTGRAQPHNDFRSGGCGVGGTRHDRLMPMLRPAQRTSLDWLTGELVHWQSEGWLEAQQADQLLRTHRAARRDVVGVLAADLAAGVAVVTRGLAAVARRCATALARMTRLSRRRPPG